MQTHNKQAIFANLPPEGNTSLLPEIQMHLKEHPHKLVVLDDDPTGTQTMHDVPVLTTWSVEALRGEFTKSGNVFYILTNSRSMNPTEAEALNIEIAKNLLVAAKVQPFSIISRSDSTLRGHFPLELDALSNGLNQAFDGWIIAPFFEEGGRFTINGVHYVAEGEQLIPAAETPFAKDATFGYSTSDMRQWVEEKTNGQIKADDVTLISIDMLRRGGVEAVLNQLMSAENGRVYVVDAASYSDIEVFVLALLQAEATGRTFLYRTAASFVRTRAGLDAYPHLDTTDIMQNTTAGGLVVVGSYVLKTSQQLAYLLKQHPAITPIELKIERLLSDEQGAYIKETVLLLDDALLRGMTAVLFTSRQLVTGNTAEESLRIGNQVSAALISILNQLTQRPAFIIAKGGITSSDVATKALNVKRAIVRGQIAPGIPVWQLDAESRYPDLPYVVFPGNVGDESTLSDVASKLTQLVVNEA